MIGSYGREQQPDEYTDRIKAKQEEMVALIAENAKTGAYTQEFDNDLVRRLVASIKVISADRIQIQFQSGIVMEQEIWNE